MKLGILDAVPPIYNEATGRTDPDSFRALFSAIGVENEMPDYRVSQGVFPSSLDSCNAYLITGSPCSVYNDEPWIAELEDFVRRAYSQNKPLIGICFGHQMIAQALGGKVENSEQGWLLGLHDLELLSSTSDQSPKPWLTSEQSTYALYFVNHDQVTELPPDAEWLGKNERCPYAMYSIGNQVLSVQAHPEHPLSSIKIFTESLKSELSAEQYQETYHSLAAGEPDATMAAQWIWNFLEQG